MSFSEPGPSSGPTPVKLKFKLGGGASPAQSPTQSDAFDTPVKSEQPPVAAVSTPSQFGGASSLPPLPDFGAGPSSSGVQSPATGGTASPAGLDANGQPIKKRRRTAKKAPGDVQPGGKGWRKGVKGVIVAGQPLPPRDPNVPIVVNNGPPSFRGFSATQSVAPAKTPAGYLAPQVLEKRTPRPREWSLGACEFASITGKPLKLRSWKGASHSPYRLAVHPTPPPQPTPQPTESLAPTPAPSAQPHPLSNQTFPTLPSTSASTSPDPSRLPTSHEPSPAPTPLAGPVSVPVVVPSPAPVA